MKFYKSQSLSSTPVTLAALMLLCSGCAHLAPGRLAPGILPIPTDSDETVDGGYTASNEASSDDELLVDEGSLEQGAVLPVSDQRSTTYTARQYPKTDYPGPQPPSVYQVPQSYQPPSGAAAAQSPQTYLPPAAPNNQPLPAPLTGLPQPQGSTYAQPLPPSVPQATPYQGSGTQPGFGQPGSLIPVPQALEPLGDIGLAPPVVLDPNSSATFDPYAGAPAQPPVYLPEIRDADARITGYPARTGRLMIGGAVNSDAGVTGQITLDERNFDITRWPSSFRDLASGTAFRGAGQTFRLEAMPGSQFKRYTASFADPNLFGYLPFSFGASAFLFDRIYQDWNEERLGGRLSLGYRVTPELSLTSALNLSNVEISKPRRTDVAALNRVLGDTDLYSAEFKLTHDTRNSPFQPSEGHFFEFSYERAFGEFQYNRFDIETRNYLLLTQRADESGKQTISLINRVGFTGQDTPLFENYFAGGYSTLRGFQFRGASPVENTVQVGGRFQWLNTLEYMFPITADDAFRGVAFVDFGTVERNIEINRENFRVAPGMGLRVAIPMLGPAPLAFDFAYPVSKADGDQKRIFSFYMSTTR